MRKTIAIALIAAAAATAACSYHRGEDGGATVSRNYPVGGFDQIEVAGPYDVDVQTGANPSVAARGSEKLLDRTTVEIEGNKLVIHPKESKGWFHVGWSNHGHARFTVTVPKLSGATIAGSGDIRVDRVNGPTFEGSVAGSGGLAIAQLEVQTLKLAIAGSGGVKAGSGQTGSARYEIAGSGDIDAGAIAAKDANVSIAGSGSVKAHATGTADIDIMGSGDVAITGGAKCSVSKAGSGDVRCS